MVPFPVAYSVVVILLEYTVVVATGNTLDGCGYPLTIGFNIKVTGTL